MCFWRPVGVRAGESGAGQNQGMKKTLLFVLALIAVGCGPSDRQSDGPSALISDSVADLMSARRDSVDDLISSEFNTPLMEPCEVTTDEVRSKTVS